MYQFLPTGFSLGEFVDYSEMSEQLLNYTKFGGLRLIIGIAKEYYRFLLYCFISNLECIKGYRGQKLRRNSGLFTPVKISGGMGKMS